MQAYGVHAGAQRSLHANVLCLLCLKAMKCKVEMSHGRPAEGETARSDTRQGASDKLEAQEELPKHFQGNSNPENHLTPAVRTPTIMRVAKQHSPLHISAVGTQGTTNGAQ